MFEMDLSIPVDDRAPSIARHALDGLSGSIPDEALERFKLTVSELVTNAIVHNAESPATDDIRLVIRIRPDRLSTSVIQAGPGFDHPVRKPAPGEETGWGLFLVDQLADRWGVERDGETEVWAEFVLTDTAA